MINRILIISALILSPTLQAQDQGNHSAYIDIGSLDFNWKEFGYNDDEFDNDTEVESELVDESGSLTTFAFGYAYSRDDYLFSAQLSQATGTVDYYGMIQIDGDRNDYKENLNTNYSIYSLEGSFGKYFDVDYIKPFAAIVGGYSKRERRVNGMANSVSPEGDVIDIATATEHMSYLYWGALLDVELFSWNNISANVGAKYSRSVNTEQEFVGDDLTIDLKPLISTELSASVSYEFLPTWKASLRFKKLRSKMAKSNEVASGSLLIHQPRSEEDHSYLGLHLQKTF